MPIGFFIIVSIMFVIIMSVVIYGLTSGRRNSLSSLCLSVEISIVPCEIGIVILLCCAPRFSLLFGAPLARKSKE